MSLSLEPRQTWTEVFPVVKDVFREGGAVAFACSALLLLLYRLLPRVRRTPGWLILRAAVCEALVSIVFFLFYYFGKDKDHAEWEMSGDGVLLAFVALQRSHRTVARSQRGRARSVNGKARALQPEGV